jgi:hypothetical protein
MNWENCCHNLHEPYPTGTVGTIIVLGNSTKAVILHDSGHHCGDMNDIYAVVESPDSAGNHWSFWWLDSMEFTPNDASLRRVAEEN